MQASDQVGRIMYKPKENKCITSFWRHRSKHLTWEGYFNPMRQAFQHTQEKLQDTMDQTVGMDHMMSCPDSSKASPPKWNRLLRFSCKLPNYGLQGEKMQQRDKLQHHKTSNIQKERNLTMPCTLPSRHVFANPAYLAVNYSQPQTWEILEKQKHPHQALRWKQAFKTFLLKAGNKKCKGWKYLFLA